MASDTTTTKGTAETMTPGISDNLTATAAPTDGDDVFTFVLYEVAVPILYGVVTLLGVTGNSLVIYVIASKERMRTVTNFLLLNLAISDLSFVIVIPPSTAYVFAANRQAAAGVFFQINVVILHSGPAINRSRLRIQAAPLLQSATLGKLLHTCASVTKQYNLVPANGR